MTSSILPAATPALGRMIDITVIIMKAMTIIIEYARNAVIAPTCISPVSILWEAIQMIATPSIFIIRTMIGCINVITLLVNS